MHSSSNKAQNVQAVFFTTDCSQLQFSKMNNPIMLEYRQRRTPGISGLFKFLLKTMQTVRNECSAQERHKTEQRESLLAGCCRQEGWSRHAQQCESGHGGVKWKFALPESNMRNRTQGEGDALQEPRCHLQHPQPGGTGKVPPSTAAREKQMTPTLSVDLKQAQFFPVK